MLNTLSRAPRKLSSQFVSLPKREVKTSAPVADNVDLSAAQAPAKDSLSWGRMALGALSLSAVALGASGCDARPVIQQEEVILHDDVDHGTMPFNLSRDFNGDVVVAFDQGDRVFNPADNNAYDAPRAAFLANYERGKSLCEQAADLGGGCVTSSLAYIPNGPHGTLQIEQTAAGTVNIGSAQLTRSENGVYVDRPGPDVLYQYDGSVINFPGR